MASDKIFSNEHLEQLNPQSQVEQEPVTVFGLTFKSEEERRQYFREELRRQLPELRKIEGFPIGEDDDIINLSDPPYYTACPNPWLNDFIKQWEEEKNQLQLEGKRKTNFDVKEPYASDVSEGKRNAVYGAHSYHTKVPHPAIMRYLMHYTQPGDIVFDGFAGTGMTGVACQMMETPEDGIKKAIENEYRDSDNDHFISWGKRKCICNDLSPLASFIAYNYTNCVNKKLFLEEYNEILSDLIKECSWMYQTKHIDGTLGTISYVVWSEVFICPDCGGSIVFYDEAVNEKGDVKKEIQCPHCGVFHAKRNLHLSQETVYDNDIKETINQTKYIPVLIVYIDRSGKERAKRPDEDDIKLLKNISESEIPDWYPTSPMMGIGSKWGDTWRAGVHNGITHVHHFYIKRSLRTLSYIYKRIENCQPEWKVIFTSIITALSKQQRYRANSGFPNMILSGTMYIGSMIREWNPISWFQGKVKGINRLLKIDYQLKNSVLIQTQSSTQLDIADCSVDYIFIDPPFGDNLMYSELNFIQESWIKVITDNHEEAIQNNSQNKSLPVYQSIMTRCFSEFYRILKYGKWMTVEFSNTSSAVWNCIQNSLSKAGFIITSVAALDKKQNSYKAIISTIAVKEDLVITCYKPSSDMHERFLKLGGTKDNVWDFIGEHLLRLPVHIEKGNATTSVVERSPKILFDRMISYYVQKGYAIPMDAQEFQQGLRERYVERDAMFFTAVQAAEYEEKKLRAPEFVPMGIIVTDEANGIEWLKNELRNNPQTRQDIYSNWLKACADPRKGDVIPELDNLLEENFIQNDDGTWRLPNINDDVDLEKLRTKALLKEFKLYLEVCRKPRGKLKDVRVEAVRAGFKQCYNDKNFADIILVGDRIPQNLLTEDEILLQYYDIACSKV